MSKGKYNLIVTAHPDDETIFFGALILSLRQSPWKIVCVTDGNADGQGTLRRKQFEKACRLLGAKENFWLGFPDIYEDRLDVGRLVDRLNEFEKPNKIFTHGILGEYGHPHHQDVCAAVHRAFEEHPSLYSTGWNCFPDLVVKINPKEFEKKARILTDIYGSETRRFIHMLPATALESFTKVKPKEVHAIYEFLRDGKKPQRRQLHHYKWLFTHFSEQDSIPKPRPF